jgi:hypothetical protein
VISTVSCELGDVCCTPGMTTGSTVCPTTVGGNVCP